MHRPARIVAAAVLAGLVFAASVPAIAAAAELKTTPMQILTEGFEGPAATYTVVDYVNPPVGLWGPVTTRKHSGNRGLWCAGSKGLNPSPFTFPGGLRTWVNFEVADTVYYYSSTVSFWYTMPELAAGDANSFVVRWQPTGGGEAQKDGWPITAVKTFRQGSAELKGIYADSSLSRKAGTVSFSFTDLLGPATAKEGATIDDVLISGWKYGPPRNLSAAASTGGTTLTWKRPFGSTDASAPLEERDIIYRVFRQAAGSSQWSQIGEIPDAQENVQFVDPTTADIAYRYAVQAWDPGPSAGAGYGVPAYFKFPAASFTGLTGHKIVAYGVAGPISGTLIRSTGAGLGGKKVTLQRSSNGTSGWVNVSSKTTGGSGYVRFDVPASASGYNYTKTYLRLVYAGGTGVSEANSAARYIDPKVYLGKPYTSTTSIKAKKTYTWRAKLKPRHYAGAGAVKLKFERKVGSAYKPYKTVTAYAYNSSTYSRVKGSYKLPYKGKWRVRAYHDDAGHYPTYSSWLYVTAK